MKKVTTDQKIKRAMIANERSLEAHTRKNGGITGVMMGKSWSNALNRLLAKKRVRYSRAKMRYVLARKVAS